MLPQCVSVWVIAMLLMHRNGLPPECFTYTVFNILNCTQWCRWCAWERERERDPTRSWRHWNNNIVHNQSLIHQRPESMQCHCEWKRRNGSFMGITFVIKHRKTTAINRATTSMMMIGGPSQHMCCICFVWSMGPAVELRLIYLIYYYASKINSTEVTNIHRCARIHTNGTQRRGRFCLYRLHRPCEARAHLFLLPFFYFVSFFLLLFLRVFLVFHCTSLWRAVRPALKCNGRGY